MDYYKDRKKESSEGINYSIERIDLLTISISGAGIYVCLETLKYLHDKEISSPDIIKVAGGLFLFAIVLSFLSQYFGRVAHFHDYLWCDYKIDIEREHDEVKISELKGKIKVHEDKTSTFASYCSLATNWSSIIMGAGLFCLLWYFFFTF